MHRLALVTVALGACNGGSARKGTEAPSARAPEVAAVEPGCDDETLRAFDPGLPGIERVAVEPRRMPDAPLDREHARTCEIAEDDDACLSRARRDVLAADPRATIEYASMDGEPDGWQAELEVDGQVRGLRVPNEVDVGVEARRLQSLGHRVVLRSGRVVYRDTSRRAVVHYSVPVPASEARVRWHATLRWPLPPDIPAALDRFQRDAHDANLVIVRFEVEPDRMTAVIACP